jgi:hypothetical protein
MGSKMLERQTAECRGETAGREFRGEVNARRRSLSLRDTSSRRGRFALGLAARLREQGLLVLRDGLLQEVVIGSKNGMTEVDNDLQIEGVGG